MYKENPEALKTNALDVLPTKAEMEKATKTYSPVSKKKKTTNKKTKKYGSGGYNRLYNYVIEGDLPTISQPKTKVVRDDAEKQIEDYAKQFKAGGSLSKEYIKKARTKPGGSNVGKKKNADGSKRNGPYAGPKGGAPKGSYPIDTKKRAKAALKLAHNAPNPKGIKDAVKKKYPSLKKKTTKKKDGGYATTGLDYMFGLHRGKNKFKMADGGPHQFTTSPFGYTLPYPIYYQGVDNSGRMVDEGVAMPGEDFNVVGNEVREYPIMKEGGKSKARQKGTKLHQMKKSWRKGKKLAVWGADGKWHHFGDSSMDDYRTHKDKGRRKNYRSRHAKNMKGNSARARAFRAYNRRTWQTGGLMDMAAIRQQPKPYSPPADTGVTGSYFDVNNPYVQKEYGIVPRLEHVKSYNPYTEPWFNTSRGEFFNMDRVYANMAGLTSKDFTDPQDKMNEAIDNYNAYFSKKNEEAMKKAYENQKKRFSFQTGGGIPKAQKGADLFTSMVPGLSPLGDPIKYDEIYGEDDIILLDDVPHGMAHINKYNKDYDYMSKKEAMDLLGSSPSTLPTVAPGTTRSTGKVTSTTAKTPDLSFAPGTDKKAYDPYKMNVWDLPLGSAAYNAFQLARGIQREPKRVNTEAGRAINRLAQLKYRPNYRPIALSTNRMRKDIRNMGTGVSGMMANLQNAQTNINNTLRDIDYQAQGQNNQYAAAAAQALLGEGAARAAERRRFDQVNAQNEAAYWAHMAALLEGVDNVTANIRPIRDQERADQVNLAAINAKNPDVFTRYNKETGELEYYYRDPSTGEFKRTAEKVTT
jgi:hypothetical protein